MRQRDLEALNAARRDREAAVVVTPLSGAPGRLVRRAAIDTDPLAPILSARLASGKSGREATAEGDVFIRVHRPPPRLVIVGAVHVTQALAPTATAAGFGVSVVDPREAFATQERFPGVTVVAQWPDPDVLRLDEDTALATLTHDPKIDDPALDAALRSGCFYIGALGSRKTHGKRVDRLTAAGFRREDLARIHAPIGLPIGAASPAEIAVAVLAEVISALRQNEPATAQRAPAEVA